MKHRVDTLRSPDSRERPACPYTGRALLLAGLLLAALSAASQPPAAGGAALVADAQARWLASPHGPWLARILPPYKTPATLPEPESRGARLTVRYCVQCHHLPNPAMHPAAAWPKVVDRMVTRMRGEGNMGELMREMMGAVEAPNEEEIHVVLEYLRRHAQRALDPRRYPDLATRGRAFREACSQCHALPDPRSRAASEWPRIVERMERNMAWMNRVVGSKADPAEPQWRLPDILGYLGAHAARR